MENLDELSAANSKVGSPATKISDRTSEEMTMDGSSLEQNPISIPSPRGDLKELLLCSKTQVVLLERMLANLTRNGEKELRIEPKSEAGNSVSVDENDVLRARPDVGIVPTPEIDETGTGRWSISSLFFPSLLGKELEYWNVDNYPSELQRQELKLGIQTYFSDWMNNDKSSKWNGIIERNWPQILTTLKTSFKDLVRRDWRQNPEYVTLPGSWDIFYHFFAEETPLLVDFNNHFEMMLRFQIVIQPPEPSHSWPGLAFGVTMIKTTNAQSIRVSEVLFMYLQLIQPNIDRAEKIAQPRQPTTGITILESTIWNFLFFYISPWKELEVRQFYSPWYDCTVLQFHLRALEGYLKTPKTVEDLSGFTLARENGECFNFVNSKGPYYLQEKRAAIAICRTRPAIAPYYTIVWINDTTIPDTRYLSANVNRTEFGTMSSFKVFLYLIDLALEEAVRTWNSAYQIVHENLNVTFTELLKIDEREKLLFDDADFSKSKLYFEGLELLRVFSEWIAESQKDLKDLRADALDSIRSEANIYNFGRLGLEDWKTLEAQWDDLIRKSDARFDTILGLIENKRVMIVSLRDGLYNATAVREAYKGTDMAESSNELARLSAELAETNTKMSRLVLIFTIMTIIYLPLGFVTGFFGMNNLHKDYLVKDMSAFAIMLSTTSIITYLLAGVGYYLFMVRAQHHEASQARSNPTNGPRKIDAASMKKDYSSLAGMFPFFAVWRRKANKIISGKEKDTAATDRPSDTMNFTSSGTARRVRNNGEKATTRVDGSSPAPFSQDQEAVASGTQRALADNIV